MSGAEEWGPWVVHDGKGCPLGKGEAFIAMTACGCIRRGVWVNDGDKPPPGMFSFWLWDSVPLEEWTGRVVQYRRRKPRALRDLISIAENPYARPPVRQPERVDA